MVLSRTILLDALALRNDSKIIPVWLMRQAGRYMQQYRRLREQYSFEELCLSHDLCVEITLQPVRRFDVDAAILFSDILFPLRALGIQVHFEEQGPKLVLPPHGIDQAQEGYEPRLMEQFPAIYEATATLARELDRPLIGFAGAPFTLAAFLYEGHGSTNWPKISSILIHEPEKIASLIPTLERLIIAHLWLQIRAGCHVVQLFDSLSHLVPPHLREQLCIDPVRRILLALAPHPLLYYKVTQDLLPKLPDIPISLDSTINLAEVSQRHRGAIQGNLDPSLLMLPHDQLRHRLTHLRNQMKGHRGYIFNLSGGVPPTTAEETIQLVVDCMHAKHADS